jgi:SAM-dependent MidA family methyltransferase
MSYSEVIEAALYDPERGFYMTGGSPGRRGAYLTSPEVGPLFGVVMARAVDTWWDELGQPDLFTVVDAGAGPGTLARSILAAEPRCAPALEYVLVERSPELRAEHETIQARAGRGVDSRDALPAPAGSAVVIANELLDNLPFDVAERRGDSWHDVRVTRLNGGDVAEVLVTADAELSALLDRLAPDAPEGGRVPVQRIATQWLRDALSITATGGRVVVIDYASTTAAMAGQPWHDWLRTYRAHLPGSHPLDALGEQDVTSAVAVDQLAVVRAPDRDRAQHEFLRAHGIEDLVAQGRREWNARAAIGDLAAVRARSRVTEAQALLDPTGLGRLRVLEWIVGPDSQAKPLL